MYAGQAQPQRRRKKRHTHGLKTVEVARGRNGYGFTISGQHPCILSCIVSGSPADRVGLKTGDFLLSVNHTDVSQASHDDVVRMIGSSRGVLILQITENVNSSESSDDEFQARPKSKYPNRTRTRQVSSKPPPEELAMVSREKRHVPGGRSRRELPDPGKLRTLSPVRDVDRRRTDKYDRYHHDMRSMGIENIDPSTGAPVMGPPASKPLKNVTSNDGIIRYRSPNTKHTIITREARLGKGDGHQTRSHPIGGNVADPSSHRRSRDTKHRPPADIHDDTDADVMLLGDYMRVVVGYVGTIGMARDSRNDSARMQSIRNAVHRLKVERKLTTMVLMEIAGNGVRLINNMGSTVALYAAEHIAFSGISPEDKRFFGIVTIHIETMDDSKVDGSEVSDSSCHVFKVSPELCSHNLHVHKARNFGIHCTVHPETQLCMEFPRSALPIMKYMSHLYRERSNDLYETEMAHIGAFSRPNFAPHKHESSGNDSRHRPGSTNRVCVVELNSNHGSTPQSEFEPESAYKFGDPNISAIYPDDRASGSSEFSLPPNPANTSESSQDNSVQLNTMERLNVRAMPDPRSSHMDHQQSHTSCQDRIKLTRQHHHEAADGVAMDTESVPSSESSQSIMSGVAPDNLDATATSLCSTRNDSCMDTSYYVSSGRQGPNVSAISAISSTDSSMGSYDTSTTPTPTLSSLVQTRPLPRPPSYPSRPVPQPPGRLPSVASDSRPPVPDRQPIVTKKAPKTPLRPPTGKKKVERPKSTPPFKRNVVGVDQDGYDSDPGSSILEPPDEWSYKVPKQSKTGSGMAGRNDPRRFSEGFVLSKQKEKNKTETSKKSGSFRQNTDKPFRRPTLSNSHESLVVAADHDVSNSALSHSRLHTAASVTAITNKGLSLPQQSAATVDNAGRAASWAVSFDKLLADNAGLQIFTDFLRKEYSEENIIFWEKCENFRKLTSPGQRKKVATQLYNDHVAENASEPVNVDSSARAAVTNALSEASQDTFEVAQSQIFQLMKQDSYARFLKSDGYKSCVMAEMEGKPLPVPDRVNNNQFPSAPPTPIDKLKKHTMKKSKSQSSAEEPGEEKRRRSLLPWNKNKGDKKIAKTTTDADLHRAPLARAESLESKPRPSLELADLSVMSKQVTGTLEEVDPSDVALRESHKFCRVILPDNSTTVIPARPAQMIRQAVEALCDRRHISLAVVNVYLAGSEQFLDMTQDLSTLGSKQIRLEKQIILRIDLPQRRHLCVRAKPSQNIATVFKPILQKYGIQNNNTLVMHVAGTGVILKDDQSISTLDQKQVIVQSLDDFKGKKRKEWGGGGNNKGTLGKPPIPKGRSEPSKQKKAFDDVIGNLFRDVLDPSSTNIDLDTIQFDVNGVWDVSKYKSEETRGSGILGFIRRNSIGEKEGNKIKPKGIKTFSSVRTSGSKLPQPNTASALPPPNPRAGRGKRFDADDERLFELLSRAQSRQMDDQRGMSARDLEMPDFLRVGGDGEIQTTTAGSLSARELGDGAGTSSSRPRSAPTARAQSVDCLLESSMNRHLRQHSDIQSQLDQGLATPRTAKLAAGNASFAYEGVMPTPNRATDYFTEEQRRPSSPNFDDSRVMERSIGDLGLCSDLQQQGVSFNTYMSKSGSSMTNLPFGLSPQQQNSSHQPMVPRRQNPPNQSVRSHGSTSSDPERLRSVTPSSEEELDITLIPPSDTSSDAEPGRLPSPPKYLNDLTLDQTERADFSPPTPLSSHSHTVPTNSVTSSVAARHSSARMSGVDMRLDLCSVASSERSGPSTPSPTTHDLVLEPDSGSEFGSIPAYIVSTQASQVSQPHKLASYSINQDTVSSRGARKSLSFDRTGTKPDSGVQVSFV